MAELSWIAVDWGTSNLRLWGMPAAGAPLFTRASDQGMARLTPEQFPSVLLALLGDVPGVFDMPREVVVCGMAGARQGWIEAPYLDVPAHLSDLAAAAAHPPSPHPNLNPRILPGLCRRVAGEEDVMRGEETQLLGLSRLEPGFSGLVCMPGTHSKWTTLRGMKVDGFSTAMTGEIHEVLSKYTVLRHSLVGESDGPDHEEGFEVGVEAGLAAPQRLTGLLFRTRAAALLSGRGADWCAGYLSGLLIGAEIGGIKDTLDGAEIRLIGGARLCALYAEALARAGARAGTLDATAATLAGLAAAREQSFAP